MSTKEPKTIAGLGWDTASLKTAAYPEELGDDPTKSLEDSGVFAVFVPENPEDKHIKTSTPVDNVP